MVLPKNHVGERRIAFFAILKRLNQVDLNRYKRYKHVPHGNANFSVIWHSIGELEKQHGLTQTDLVSPLSLRCSQGCISNLESENHHNVNASYLFEIDEILESTVGDLFKTLSHTSSSKKLLSETVDELVGASWWGD